MAGDAFGALPSICLLVVSMMMMVMMMVMMMLMVMMMVVMVVMLIKILSTLAPVSVKGTKQNDQYFTLVQIRCATTSSRMPPLIGDVDEEEKTREQWSDKWEENEGI